jgi:predicted nucleic acid-binding protein
MVIDIQDSELNQFVLVDTDVFSYLFKGDSRGEAFKPYIKGRNLFLSFASLGELLGSDVNSGYQTYS